MQPSPSERLKFIREKAGGISQQKLADAIQVPVSRIKDVESGKNSITIDLGLKLEAFSNCDFKWILTGEGHPDAKSTDIIPCLNKMPGEHGPHGASFQDKRYAMDLETYLAELERLSPETYKKIGTYIKGVLDGIRMGRQSFGDRRQGERRTKDAPDQIPNGKDRRGGCDRRKGAA